MPKLKKETIEDRYREINDIYMQFTYLITKYNVDPEMYNKEMPSVAAKLRLLLKKFL